MKEDASSASGTLDDLQDLFDNAPCGYLSIDAGGKISRANKTLADWLETDPASLAGRRFPELLTIGGSLFYETHFAPLLRMQGSFSEVALDLSCPSGRALPVIVNAVERRDDAGRALFTRITIFGAAERHRHERNLLDARTAAEDTLARERETAELREEFIAVLGHDLRNPLASIASGVRLLQRNETGEDRLQILHLMGGSVQRAAGLIDDVLDFARGRLGSGMDLSIDAEKPLAPLLRQVVDELRSIAPDRTIETRIDLPDPLAVDQRRIGQLLSNLLGNAIAHGDAAVPIRVAAGMVAGQLEISVSNGGPQIPAETMDHLFRPFFRGRARPSQQGLGLGLYIASEIAKAHGGMLSVQSSPEETRFTFRMPLAGQGAESRSSPG